MDRLFEPKLYLFITLGLFVLYALEQPSWLPQYGVFITLFFSPLLGITATVVYSRRNPTKLSARGAWCYALIFTILLFFALSMMMAMTLRI